MGQIVSGTRPRNPENYKQLKTAFEKLQKLNYKVCSVWKNDQYIGKTLCTTNKKQGIVQIFSKKAMDTFNDFNNIVVFLFENIDELLKVITAVQKDKAIDREKQGKLMFYLNKMIEKSNCRIDMAAGAAVNAERNGMTKLLSLATVTGFAIIPEKSAISLDHCSNKDVKFEQEDALRSALLAVIKEASALDKLLTGVCHTLPRHNSVAFNQQFASEWPFYGKESIPNLIQSPVDTQKDTPKKNKDPPKRAAIAVANEAKGTSPKKLEMSGSNKGKVRESASAQRASGVKGKQMNLQPKPKEDKIAMSDPQDNIVRNLRAELKRSNEICKQYSDDIQAKERDILSLTKENEALVKEKENIQKGFESRIAEVNQNHESVKKSFLDQAQKMRNHYEGELGKLEIQLCNMKDQNQEAGIKAKDLTERLAAEMNIKISANESSLENISIKCRPMKIAEDYSMFVSGPWLDAKQAMDDEKIPEEDATKFLCSILQISSKQAQVMFEERILSPLSKLQRNVRHPMQQPKDGAGAKDTAFSENSPLASFYSTIGDQLRRDAENVDIIPLYAEILKATRNKFEKSEKTLKLKTTLASKAVQQYIKDSALLAWKMVIQRPPMTYVTPDVGKKFQGENVHPLAWGSQPMEANKPRNIKYYQYPTLMHGEKVMVLGKVFVI